MENLFIYLDSCNTCKRILKELTLPQGFKLQNVKSDPITASQLDFLYTQSKSYEALFNRRSQLYRQRGLHEQQLTESDYKALLLEHYTFIKRPILIFNNIAYIGNSKNTIEAAVNAVKS